MQFDSDSKRLRRVAMIAVSIAAVLVALSTVSCTSASSNTTKPAAEHAASPAVQPALRSVKGDNQICDLCHEGNDDDVQMLLYVFVPGQPDMDFAVAEKLLQGEDS